MRRRILHRGIIRAGVLFSLVPVFEGSAAPPPAASTAVAATHPSTAPASAPTTRRSSRILPPPEREQDRSRERIRQIFKDDYARRKPADMRSLADRLLQTARETREDIPTRYVLLAESRECALKSDDPSRALRAVDMLVEEFDVNELNVKADVLTRMARAIPPGLTKYEAARQILAAVDACVTAERYDLAEQLVAALPLVIPPTGGAVLRTDTAAQKQRVRQLRQAHEKVQPMLAVLQTASDDPQANLAAGRWYCFVKGDWARGLPHLCRSADAQLSVMARKDSTPPQTTDAQVELADAWWNYAETVADAGERAACQARASYWYQTSLPLITGLEKARIEQRLKTNLSASEAGKQPRPRQITLELGHGIDMEFALIPAGDFMMGTKLSAQELQTRFGGQSEWYAVELPRHRVKIGRPLYVGKFEVTQEQWQSVMGSNPSQLRSDARLPVEKVSWLDCQAFCARISEKIGRHVRLPTEAEWEYACRAGTTGEFGAGDSAGDLARHGWYGENSNRQTHPAGQKTPNRWGLHDMLGNVGEWCADWYGTYDPQEVEDPEGPAGGTERIVRGGSWPANPGFVRCAHRWRSRPDLRSESIGVRVVLDAE